MPRKKTQEEFLKDAKATHGDLYDYSKTIYTNSHDKIIITCKVHGDFTMKATSHTINKQGCAQCAGNVKMTTKDFVIKAKEVHGDLYNYDKVEYTTAHSKVTVNCPIHGDFNQQAYVHLQNHGCPECGSIAAGLKNLDNPDIWTYRGWAEAGETSNYFQEYSLYIIECWNKDDERFYKVGKTFMALNRRFTNGKVMPYAWRLIEKLIGSPEYISGLEEYLHKHLKDYRVVPSTQFNGSRECYTDYCLDNYKRLIQEYI